MKKIRKNLKNNNIVKFPSKLNSIEKEVEALVFAALEPLDIDTIESKISKKTDVLKILEKLQSEYSTRGINLVSISNKWSFRTSKDLVNLMYLKGIKFYAAKLLMLEMFYLKRSLNSLNLRLLKDWFLSNL